MKTALGKGLDALIPDKGDEVTGIEIRRITANRQQPRKIFRDDALRELAASIKEKGVLQPIIVSRQSGGTFRIVAGERRWRAASMAGLKKIPALVRETTAEDSIEIALIENIQREDLNPIETAEAFERLIRQFKLTQEELSRKVGKDRATVANFLRLLKLPEKVKAYINEGRLSMGHAKVLLSIEGRQSQSAAADKIIRQGLSVREVEALAKKLQTPGTAAGTEAKRKDPQIVQLQRKLKRHLGADVSIRQKGNRGSITIGYASLDELDHILDVLLG